MDELNRGCTSFNWSDEEINTPEQRDQEKYSKKKRPNSKEKPSYKAPAKVTKPQYKAPPKVTKPVQELKRLDTS